MLEKDELVAIQRGFEAKKLFAAEHGHTLEIGYYEVACYQIAELVRNVVKSVEHSEAYVWLVNVLFVKPAKLAFATAKEAYIHVMAALDALIAVVGEIKGK